MPTMMTHNEKTMYEPSMHGIAMNGVGGSGSGYLTSGSYLPPPPPPPSSIGQPVGAGQVGISQSGLSQAMGVPLGAPLGAPLGGGFADPALSYSSWTYNTRPELNRSSSSYYLGPSYAFSAQQQQQPAMRSGSASYQLPSLNTLLSSIQAPISRSLPLPGSKPVLDADKPLDYKFHGALPPLLHSESAPSVATTVAASSSPMTTHKAPKAVANQNYYTASGNPRKHICKTCGKGFTTSGHLARHNRIHTGVKNHVCSFAGCDARFSRQDNCIQHYKTHLKAKKGQRKMRL